MGTAFRKHLIEPDIFNQGVRTVVSPLPQSNLEPFLTPFKLPEIGQQHASFLMMNVSFTIHEFPEQSTSLKQFPLVLLRQPS